MGGKDPQKAVHAVQQLAKSKGKDAKGMMRAMQEEGYLGKGTRSERGDDARGTRGGTTPPAFAGRAPVESLDDLESRVTGHAGNFSRNFYCYYFLTIGFGDSFE